MKTFEIVNNTLFLSKGRQKEMICMKILNVYWHKLITTISTTSGFRHDTIVDASWQINNLFFEELILIFSVFLSS